METFPLQIKYSVFYKLRQRFGKPIPESRHSAQFYPTVFVQNAILHTMQVCGKQPMLRDFITEKERISQYNKKTKPENKEALL